jgi:putative ABC transport system substrate-binding protein
MGKRLQLLKELLPDLKRVGVIYNGANPGLVTHKEALLQAAVHYSVEVIDAPMTGPQDLGAAVERTVSGGAQATIGLTNDNLTFLLRKELTGLMRQHRLPSLFPSREYAQDGGLLAYAPSLRRLFRRSSYVVDRVLRGTEPATFPLEQPTELHLVVNLATARQIGLTIPDHLTAAADEVID